MEQIAYGTDGAWHVVGNISSATFDLSALSVVETPKDGGELTMETGVFTF